jgi:hypothetical protein
VRAFQDLQPCAGFVDTFPAQGVATLRKTKRKEKSNGRQVRLHELRNFMA